MRIGLVPTLLLALTLLAACQPTSDSNPAPRAATSAPAAPPAASTPSSAAPQTATPAAADNFPRTTVRVGTVGSITDAGFAIGIGGALALTRFLTTMLFGVTPTDSVTFVVVSVVFFVIAMVASLIPALRATRVDPLVALRYE